MVRLDRASVCARALMVPAAYVVAPVPTARGPATPALRHTALLLPSQQPSHFCPQNAHHRTAQNVTSPSHVNTQLFLDSKQSNSILLWIFTILFIQTSNVNLQVPHT